MLSFTIQKEEADQTIISLLKKKFKSTPLSLIHKLFRTKKIQINGKDIRYYHHRLKKGEVIEVYDNSLKVHQPKFSPPVKTGIDLEITYEDENVLLVAKEPNVEVHSSENNNCLNNAVRYYLYQQNPAYYQEQFKSLFVLNAVHRLDKLVAGLVIYPKNPVAKKILSKAINDKEKITKKYLAVCENPLKKRLPGYITGYLWKNEKAEKMEFSPKQEKENAKYCALEIKELNQKNNRLLLEITLHTGRKHQIRSILAYFSCPIAGDRKYGSKIMLNNQIYLLAYKIMFNNLPAPLSYLNGQEFCWRELESKFRKNTSALT